MHDLEIMALTVTYVALKVDKWYQEMSAIITFCANLTSCFERLAWGLFGHTSFAGVCAEEFLVDKNKSEFREGNPL